MKGAASAALFQFSRSRSAAYFLRQVCCRQRRPHRLRACSPAAITGARVMQHQLPPLPFAMNALEPHMSAETLEFHYGKHHRTYVDKLNELIKNTEHENMDLEEIVRSSQGPIFNNAAQTWNHTFFWNCLTPNSGKVEGE